MNSGDTVLPSQHNPAMQDIAQALSSSLPRTGAAQMLGPLVMNGNRITGLADGVAMSDAATVRQTQQGITVPVGCVLDFWGTVIPEGFLLAAGQELLRSEYADLFSVIGTNAGVGNGSTTFRLPDYRGNVSAGKADMGGTLVNRLSNFASSVMGAMFGEQAIALLRSQMPQHDHGAATGVTGNHSHGLNARSGGDGPTFVGTNTTNANGAPSLATGVAGEHAHSINNDGGGQAHPNVQPTIVCNKIIRVL